MNSLDALHRLERNGCTMTEAYRLLVYIREEREMPSSRTKSSKLDRVLCLMREAGISPDEVEFDAHGAI